MKETRPPEIHDLPEAEAEAVRLAQRGDASAFERLYRLHCRRVFALCLSMLKNRVEAEDLAQDTFLKVFRMIHRFRGESAFSTWLYRVTVNQVLMRLRKKNLAQASLEEIMESNDETSATQQKLGGSDLRLNGTLDRVTLERALDQLSPGYKAAFVLHDIHGYEHSEIAELLGCSPGNSKSQLHKARMRLRQLLRRRPRSVVAKDRCPSPRSGSPRAASLLPPQAWETS